MRQAYAAFAEGGAEGALPFLDEQIEIEESEFPDTGTFKGHAAVLRLVSLFTETVDDFRVEPKDFIAGTDDRVVVVLNVIGIAKASRMPTDIPAYHVHTLRDGKSVLMRVFLDRVKALDAAGLSE